MGLNRRLTVGVPVYNSESRLRDFLPALQRQVGRNLYDLVFVVDNGSQDRTLTVLRAFKKEYGVEYSSITVDSIPRIEASADSIKITNIANARNQIIDLSPAENDILYIDDDVLPEPDSIRRIVGFMHRFKCDIATGLYPIAKKTEKGVEIIFDAFKYKKDGNLYPPGKSIESGKSEVSLQEWRRHPIEVDAVGTGFCLIKRRVLNRVRFKPPNEKYTSEDFIFCEEAREQGFKIMVDPSIILNHKRLEYMLTVENGLAKLTYIRG